MAQETRVGGASQPRVPTRRRWLRRTLWGGGGAILSLVLLAIFVPPLLPEGFVGRLVARRLSAATGREATVQGARFSFLSGLRARGIALAERPGFGPEPFARIGRLAATPRSLFGGLGRLASLEVADAELRLVRNTQGVLNVADLAERPPAELELGHLHIANLELFYHDLEGGGRASVVIASADVFPPVRGRRGIRLGARLPGGGAVMLHGDAWLSSLDGALDRVKAEIVARSVALGSLVRGLRPGHALPSVLAEAALNADLALEGRVGRLLRGKGTLWLTGLPETPQLGFIGPERALAATLEGELSPFKPHFGLELATHPGEAARLTASLRQIVADGSVPSFSMDNYVLDVKAAVRADLSQGGIPGTPLVAGSASLDASLAGTMAEAKLAARGALADAAVALGNVFEPLPSAGLELDGAFSIAGLWAELSRFALATRGLNVAARGAAWPRNDAELRIAPDGSLPAMSGEWVAECVAEFGDWTPALRVLAGLPAGRPDGGAVRASARAALDGECRYVLGLSADKVPFDQDVRAAARLPLLAIINAVVGGRPEAMDATASLDAAFTARGTSREAVAASFAGKGQLTLDRLRIVGSPLFRLLADWSGRPELRDVAFERMEAPFRVAGARTTATATLPHGGGALVFRGHSTDADGLRYTLHVREPREVAFIPRDVVAYLESGLPLMHITGPPESPDARIPLEAILRFNLAPRAPAPQRE